MNPTLRLLAERIRQAAADGTPLRIRGGGTKDFHGGGARRGELLETRTLAGITSYEPSELVVTARAGTPLVELEAALAERGQYLPFEPPHFGSGASVGGMVAAGLSGPARASVGAVRDYVLGATMLNGRGELLSFGGQVMKNVAGYDISRLLAGSLGVLGLITEVSLKVLPRPPAEATLRFELGQAEALARLQRWGARPLPLNASCWSSNWPQADAGQLLLRLRGAAAAVDAACRALGGERLAPEAAVAEWTRCREQRLPWFEARGARALWRLSLPPAAPVLSGLPETPFIEWHGALRWVRAPARQAASLRQAAASVGGSAMLFIASELDENLPCSRLEPPTPVLGRIQRQLKMAFDPAGIFNPGRLLPEF